MTIEERVKLQRLEESGRQILAGGPGSGRHPEGGDKPEGDSYEQHKSAAYEQGVKSEKLSRSASAMDKKKSAYVDKYAPQRGLAHKMAMDNHNKAAEMHRTAMDKAPDQKSGEAHERAADRHEKQAEYHNAMVKQFSK